MCGGDDEEEVVVVGGLIPLGGVKEGGGLELTDSQNIGGLLEVNNSQLTDFVRPLATGEKQDMRRISGNLKVGL